MSSKALLHTVFHILGRYHEHERADRREYIDIIAENIIEGIIIMQICMYIHTCALYTNKHAHK